MFKFFKKIIVKHKIIATIQALNKIGNYSWVNFSNGERLYCNYDINSQCLEVSAYLDNNFNKKIFTIEIDNQGFVEVQEYAIKTSNLKDIVFYLDGIIKHSKSEVKRIKKYNETNEKKLFKEAQ